MADPDPHQFEPELSDEHAPAGWFSVEETGDMKVPGAYRAVIANGVG